MNLYTVYNSPSDYPNDYVVRRWQITEQSKAPVAMNIIIIGKNLAEIRKQLAAMGLYQIPRDVTDDKNIVETWI